jgi:hypothetical protein
MATEDIPPTTVKLAPVIVACETVTAAVPVLVSVKVCGLLDPATTFPKLRLVEFAASVPAEEVEVDFSAGLPAPVNATQPASDIIAKPARSRASRPSGARRLETA